MHELRGAHDRVHGAGLDALGAADARGLVDQRDARRRARAALAGRAAWARGPAARRAGARPPRRRAGSDRCPPRPPRSPPRRGGSPRSRTCVHCVCGRIASMRAAITRSSSSVGGAYAQARDSCAMRAMARAAAPEHDGRSQRGVVAHGARDALGGQLAHVGQHGGRQARRRSPAAPRRACWPRSSGPRLPRRRSGGRGWWGARSRPRRRRRWRRRRAPRRTSCARRASAAAASASARRERRPRPPRRRPRGRGARSPRHRPARTRRRRPACGARRRASAPSA